MDSRKIIKKLTGPLKGSALYEPVKNIGKLIPRGELQFEVHLAEHCNLNCKGCDNYSPLARKEFLDLGEYERDCRRLSEMFGGKIERLLLLGGEPLLHPQISDFLRISRECFPSGEICIVTNGILLPKMPGVFWENCRKYSIVIEPTKYPITFDYDAAEKKARNGGVTYRYFNNAAVVKTLSKRPLDTTGGQPIIHNFLKCHRSNVCIMLKHGKLYTCSAAPNAPIINDYFHMGMKIDENNGIDIHQAKSAREIMRFLARPIPFCRYCNIDATVDEFEWRPSKKEKSEWL